ncbi:MAG: hypothetical protein CL609_20470 [Anaerolineaceae bacterium]|nr:hypothetical protein [Anaerolineaceae bacterium]
MKTMQLFITPLINEMAGFALILLVWVFASFFYPVYIIPSPWEVVNNLNGLMLQNFIGHLQITFFRIGTGFTISMVVGTAIGVWATIKKKTATLNSMMMVIQVLPGMILAVIFLLLFGLGNLTPIILIATLTLPTLVINTMNGLAKRSTALEEYLSTIKSRQSVWFSHIIFPTLVPVLGSNFSLGIGLAAKIVVMGEFVGAQDGLGYLLNNARITFDMRMVFFYLVILLLVTLFFQAVQSLCFSIAFKKYFYAE